MGMGAALKLGAIISNTTTIFAIELLCAAQGIDLLRPLRTSAPLEALHASVRGRVEVWREDREMAQDISRAVGFLDDIDPFIEELL